MNKLKEIRLAREMTQAEVAEAVGIAESAYQRYEYGRLPTVITAIRIARALKSTCEEIWGD